MDDWYIPAAQVVQLVDVVGSANFPAGQKIQLSAPDDGWYCPGGQLAHGDRPPLNLPAAQVELQLKEPVFEKSAAGHSEHVIDEIAPIARENVPAAHATQLAEPVAG